MENPLVGTTSEDVRSSQIPGWLTVLQDWKGIVWPAFVAILAGFFYFLGFVFNNGRLTALGIYRVIERPQINQEYFNRGAATLAIIAIYAAVILAFAAVIRAIVVRLFRLLPNKLQEPLRAITKRRTWGWLVVGVAVATWLFETFILKALVKDADSLILKSQKELGTSWMSLGLNADRNSVYGYIFLVVGILVLFVAISWWILTKFTRSTVGRMSYGAWAALNILMLVSECAFLLGVSTSFDEYPIVAFSNMDHLLENDSVTALLGSDDKQYAFLVILKVNAGSETPEFGKVILYVPRSEIKWMMVLREMPLNLISHYHDFKDLLRTMPRPNPPGENPKH